MVGTNNPYDLAYSKVSKKQSAGEARKTPTKEPLQNTYTDFSIYEDRPLSQPARFETPPLKSSNHWLVVAIILVIIGALEVAIDAPKLRITRVSLAIIGLNIGITYFMIRTMRKPLSFKLPHINPLSKFKREKSAAELCEAIKKQ